MNRSSFDRAGLALMLSTILVWAGSWIAMKLIVPYIGPFDFVALRYVTGAVVLFVLALATRRPLAMPPWGLTLLIGLTQTAGFQGFVQTALVSGGVGKVSLMAYTMPFWVVLFAWWLLRERPPSGMPPASGWRRSAWSVSSSPGTGWAISSPCCWDWAVDCAGAWARCCPSACSSAIAPT